MKKLLTLFILTIAIGIYQTYAKDQTTKEQIKHNEKLKAFCKIEDLDQKANAIFSYFFKETIVEDLIVEGFTDYTIEDIKIIQKNHDSISEEDYEAVFKDVKSDTISKEEENARIMLIDSICAYYGISTKNLIKIRQNKKLIGRKDIKTEEVNKLFNECFKVINEKFVKSTTLDENKLAELIAKKLIEKQNESTMSIVPDCPPLI